MDSILKSVATMDEGRHPIVKSDDDRENDDGSRDPSLRDQKEEDCRILVESVESHPDLVSDRQHHNTDPAFGLDDSSREFSE